MVFASSCFPRPVTSIFILSYPIPILSYPIRSNKTLLESQSRTDFAPVGRIMNSCMASLLPAWLPPLMTLNAGTGRISRLLPARSAMCWYRGTPCNHSKKYHYYYLLKADSPVHTGHLRAFPKFKSHTS